MKLLLLLLLVISCEQSGGGGGSSSATSTDEGRSCETTIDADDIIGRSYTGTTVSNCDTVHGGQTSEYTITATPLTENNYLGWRLTSNDTFTVTDSGGTVNSNISFPYGGASNQNDDSYDFALSFKFTGVDNTTCQNAHSVNGNEDWLLVEVKAKYNSDCNVVLEGTIKEYSKCTNSTDVDICTGTITLE